MPIFEVAMHVWQIQPDRSLQLTEVAAPELGPEEVLLEVKAVGVNRADLLQIKGLYPAPRGFDSSIPGLEYAGVIVAVGKRVLTRQVGDAVMGLIPSGAYAQQLAVHESETLQVPTGLSFAQAATIPEAFLTSYRALFLEGGLQSGQWCLIRPATAGVGLAAVQLATAFGARAIGSSRDIEKLAAAERFGLRALVREDQSLAISVKQQVAEGVAVVMDMLGPDWQNLLQCLRSEGTLVSVGMMAGTETTLNLATLLLNRQKIHPMTMRSQPLEKRIALAKLFNDCLLPLFAEGKLQPLPLRSFSFQDAQAAHQDMLVGQWSGKRVLVL